MSEDEAFHLGGLLYERGCFTEALASFARSLELYGPTAPTLYGVGLSCYQLGQLGDALRCFEEALLLDPALEAAAVARRTVRAELARSRRAAG